MSSSKRRICFFTGTRAEYGLLYWLMKEVAADPQLSLQLIVSGSHLSPEFGLTYRQIEKDGFKIDRKVQILLSSDDAVGMCKSIGLGVSGFGEALADLAPDVVVIVGDRYEALAAAIAASTLRIPVAHIHGGETTLGALDEYYRHAITKMSHLHFAATDEYRRRIIQLGENPKRVYNCGGLGLDNVRRLRLLKRGELESELGFRLRETNFLITFHPTTLDEDSSEAQFTELLGALDKYRAECDLGLLITKPNADCGGRSIIRMIDDYISDARKNAKAFTNLGQVRYLSAVRHMDAVVGNSSSGLIEVPAFKTATVNIGDRQAGRILATSVVNCAPKQSRIYAALKIATSPGFRQKLKDVKNPYGTGGGAVKIRRILARTRLEGITRKPFYDYSIT